MKREGENREGGRHETEIYRGALRGWFSIALLYSVAHANRFRQKAQSMITRFSFVHLEQISKIFRKKVANIKYLVSKA